MVGVDHTTPCMGPHQCVGCDTVLDGNVIVCRTCWLGTDLRKRIGYVTSIDNMDISDSLAVLHGHATASLIREVKANRQKRLDATNQLPGELRQMSSDRGPDQHPGDPRPTVRPPVPGQRD